MNTVKSIKTFFNSLNNKTKQKKNYRWIFFKKGITINNNHKIILKQ